MKGSARARTVIAAPVNAEERLLKVCASPADNAAPKVYESEAKFLFSATLAAAKGSAIHFQIKNSKFFWIGFKTRILCELVANWAIR